MKCFLVSRTKQGSSVPAVSSDTVTAECSVPAVYQLPPHYLECPPCCFIHVSVSHLALLICLKHLQYFQLIYLLGPPSSAWDNQHSLWGMYNIFSTHHFLALHMEVVRRVLFPVLQTPLSVEVSIKGLQLRRLLSSLSSQVVCRISFFCRTHHLTVQNQWRQLHCG